VVLNPPDTAYSPKVMGYNGVGMKYRVWVGGIKYKVYGIGYTVWEGEVSS